MKVEVFSQKAKKVSDLEVSDAIFGSKVNPKVLAQYLYIYLSNQRESNANTKVKSEVRGGGKKPHAQKGTGRARAGSSRSPLWRGGGVTFGPTNQINWKKKITKSFRASAFRNALSKLTQDKLLKFIDTVEIVGDDKFTKQALDIVENFGSAKKMTIITNEKNTNLIKAFSNLEKKRIILVTDLNVYDLINGGEILIEEKALEYINKLAK